MSTVTAFFSLFLLNPPIESNKAPLVLSDFGKEGVPEGGDGAAAGGGGAADGGGGAADGGGGADGGEATLANLTDCFKPALSTSPEP